MKKRELTYKDPKNEPIVDDEAPTGDDDSNKEKDAI
jgi:hypothetical protein